MAPRNKYTREQMTAAAVKIVRENGTAGLTARAIAKELGVSTQPVFTCFSSMAEAKKEVRAAAQDLYDEYVSEGLKEKIPFFGFGMAYVHFAKEEPELYKLLFLDCEKNETIEAMEHSTELVRSSLMRIYRIDAAAADRYFRDMWLVIHSIATLCVTCGSPYSEEEIAKIMTGFSVSLCRSIKEIHGFVEGEYDYYEIFKTLVTKGKYSDEEVK